MKKQKGFIQMPLLIAIIAGVLVLGGVVYFGLKEYKNYKDFLAAQQKILASSTQELEQLKKNLEQQKSTSQKPSATQPSKTGLSPEKFEALKEKLLLNKLKSQEIVASDLTPYLSGVIDIDCGNVKGSGSLWNFSGLGYIVMTNNHVVSDAETSNDHCIFNPMSNDDKIGYGLYDLDLSINKKWNYYTDIAVMNFKIDESLNCIFMKTGGSLPINQLNYKISSLRKCLTTMVLGSPVAIIGYPASTYKQIDIPNTNSTAAMSSRTVTNGIISALDRTVTYPIGNLPYPNYFVSAKIDSGNSGGIALSKDNNGLCVLGIPTWLNIGNYDTQGIIQNIHNVLSQ